MRIRRFVESRSIKNYLSIIKDCFVDISDEFETGTISSLGGEFHISIRNPNSHRGTPDHFSGRDKFKTFAKSNILLFKRILEFEDRLSQDVRFTWVVDITENSIYITIRIPEVSCSCSMGKIPCSCHNCDYGFTDCEDCNGCGNLDCLNCGGSGNLDCPKCALEKD